MVSLYNVCKYMKNTEKGVWWDITTFLAVGRKA